ncbi:MAG: TetR/AcrR family transcriptional regulator [Chloroflexi bacterium]|nr:TetR/AcrR family transcriptional regulator [Chloroflexota bacterium]
MLKDSPRRRRGQDTRARLMEAATVVLAHSGFDRATVDEIVREAGFSKGAFYVHFETKEDLFWAMLEERISRQQEAFRQAVEHTQPLADNMRMILSGVFKLLRDDPLWGSLYAEFAAHASRNEKVRQRLAAMYDRWRELIVDILSASRDAGRTRKDIDLRFAATLLIATVEGSIMQSHLAPETVRLEAMLEPLTRTLSEWLAPD